MKESIMGSANSAYYKRKGSRIYLDFKTYAHSGKLLAGANAKEFCEKFANSKETIFVAEFGVGNGKFALDFLDEVKKQDATVYARVTYALFDFSSRMLADAQISLAAHLGKCRFIGFDAAKEKLPSEFFGKIKYARMNELLDDLPCEFYALQKGEVVEAEFGMDGQVTGFIGAEGERSIIAGDFLSRVGENYILPFNFVACEFACELGKALAKDGVIDIFDYGFASAEDVVSQPAHMWNENIVREFDKQLTTDLNVPLLCAFAKSAGLKVQAEGQKEYVESVLGKKVSIENTKYSKSARGIGESDMFYHVRLASTL